MKFLLLIFLFDKWENKSSESFNDLLKIIELSSVGLSNWIQAVPF